MGIVNRFLRFLARAPGLRAYRIGFEDYDLGVINARSEQDARDAAAKRYGYRDEADFARSRGQLGSRLHGLWAERI